MSTWNKKRAGIRLLSPVTLEFTLRKQTYLMFSSQLLLRHISTNVCRRLLSEQNIFFDVPLFSSKGKRYEHCIKILPSWGTQLE